MCNYEIEDAKENICSRFSDTVSQEIDYTFICLQRNHPLAWGLNKKNF